METIYSTEDKSEAQRLSDLLTKDGINSQTQQAGSWFEVQVPQDKAAEAFRTLTHFLKG